MGSASFLFCVIHHQHEKKIMLSRIAIACSLIVFVGCGGGPSVEPVSGTVKLDGTPIEGAVITFKPTASSTGRAATGTTDASGKYTLTDQNSKKIGSGAAVGEYKVGVLWFKPTGPDTSKATGESTGDTKSADDKASRSGVTGPEALLPVAYQDPETSGLTASVKSGGGSDFSFELDSKFQPAK